MEASVYYFLVFALCFLLPQCTTFSNNCEIQHRDATLTPCREVGCLDIQGNWISEAHTTTLQVNDLL